MNLIYKAALGWAISCLSLTTAQATTVTVATETGIALETEYGIRTYSDTGEYNTITRGVDLAGMQVTATFSDGSTELVTWAAEDIYTNGSAQGSNFSLSMGDLPTMTLNSALLMTSLTLDASTSRSETVDFRIPGDPLVTYGASLFDALPDNEGTPNNTPGSLFGFPVNFFVGTDPEGTVAVTYSGAVNLAGSPAAGDLFTTMMLDFSGLTAGGFMGSTLFETDMDTLAVAGDLYAPGVVVQEPSPVPLPAALPMLLAGLGGLSLLRRRQNRS